MAGFVAEALAYGWGFDDRPEPQADNPSGDWEQIESQLDELVAFHKRQSEQRMDKDAIARRIFNGVRGLLTPKWDTIEILAFNLQEQQTIQEDELQQILNDNDQN